MVVTAYRRLVDFNGDGKADIAGIDANNDMKLYTGNGAGRLVGTGSEMWILRRALGQLQAHRRRRLQR
jgi:hypothetical protein